MNIQDIEEALPKKDAKALRKAIIDLYSVPKNATMRAILRQKIEKAFVEAWTEGSELPEEYASLRPFLEKPKDVPNGTKNGTNGTKEKMDLESFVASDGAAHMSHDEGNFIVTLERGVEVSAIATNLNDAIEKALGKFMGKVEK
jgi:hypothetical protein